MAEVLAAAASGAGLLSLAIQLGESAVKLKRVLNQLKNADSSLEHVVQEIEVFSLLLQQIEHDRIEHESQDTVLLTNCMELCQKSVARIVQTTQNLEAAFQKSKTKGRISFIFKEPEIEKYCVELERAKSSLALAHQLYAESRRRKDFHDHRQALQVVQNTQFDLCRSVQTKSIEDGCDHCTIETVSSPDLNRRRRKGYGIQTRFRYQVRLSNWFTGQVWQFAAARAQSGWTIHLRTYCVRPYDAPIFTACQDGDLNEIRRLIATGEASFLDRDLYDWSLLEQAALGGHVDICQYLLEQDHFRNGHDKNVSALFYLWRFMLRTKAKRDFKAVGKLLVEDCNENLDRFTHTDCISEGLSFTVIPDNFCVRLYHKELFPPFSSQPISARLQFALNLAEYQCLPLHFLYAAGENSVSGSFATARTSTGNTALHYAAKMMARALERELSQAGNLQTWTKFAYDLLFAGADPVAIWKLNDMALTPFQNLLGASSVKNAMEHLQQWIWVLYRCGIDLLSYGKQESDHWFRCHVPGKPVVLPLRYSNYRHAIAFSMYKFSYGPLPEDWNFTLNATISYTVYEFKPIPGAWVETSDLSKFLPSFICWDPSHYERQEPGSWTAIYSRNLTRQYDVRTVREELDLSYHERLFSRSEDDHGIVAMRIDRVSALKRMSRSRSKSQPPSVYRRRGEHYVRTFGVRDGLQNLHLCPVTSRLEFCSTRELRDCYTAESDPKIDWEYRLGDLQLEAKSQKGEIEKES